MKSEKNISAWGALLLMLSVALGAFGAHLLETKLETDQLDIYQKAVDYLTWNSLGLLLISLLPLAANLKGRGALLLILGIMLFSGSLFIYSLSFLVSEDGWKIFAMITPVGGTSLILGWGYLAFNLFKK